MVFRRVAVGGGVALFVALVFPALVLLSLPAAAQTAPQYEDSDPAAGSSRQGAPAIVSATFSEPLDDTSSLSVVNECGERLDDGNTVVELDEMRIGVAVRHWSGTYTVNYTAVGVGGLTGTNKGSFKFEVVDGHSCKGDDKKHKHGNKDKNEHEHEGNGEKERMHGHDARDDEHDGHGGDAAAGAGHSGMSDHSAMSGTDHGGHEMGSGTAHGGSKGAGHNKHGAAAGGNGGGHKGHGGQGSPGGSFASDPLPRSPADGQAVAIALALCAGMGLIGGMFLRSSVH